MTHITHLWMDGWTDRHYCVPKLPQKPPPSTQQHTSASPNATTFTVEPVGELCGHATKINPLHACRIKADFCSATCIVCPKTRTEKCHKLACFAWF